MYRHSLNFFVNSGMIQMSFYPSLVRNMIKLLLISASAGAGHVRAAEALKALAMRSYPGIAATHIDMMDYVSKPMKKTMVDAYAMMVQQAPRLWGLLYNRSNRKETTTQHLKRLSTALTDMNASAFYDYVESVAPDIILCTHFLPANTLLNAQKRLSNCPPITFLTTDYDLHSFYVADRMRQYFVANEKMKWKLVHQGIPETTVTPSGIPVHPCYKDQKNLVDLRKKYQISEQSPVVLLLSGGQGLMKLDDVVSTLFSLPQTTTLIAIAGKNKTLERRLRALAPPSHLTLNIVGWTDRMDEYMALADVIVSKPGGLTTTECIALGKPMIITNPIPGQEEHNAYHILESGYGKVAQTPLDLLYYVQLPKKDLAPGFFTTQKSQPEAGRVILDKIVELTS